MTEKLLEDYKQQQIRDVKYIADHLRRIAAEFEQQAIQALNEDYLNKCKPTMDLTTMEVTIWAVGMLLPVPGNLKLFDLIRTANRIDQLKQGGGK
jgi:hypothetical protein